MGGGNWLWVASPLPFFLRSACEENTLFFCSCPFSGERLWDKRVNRGLWFQRSIICPIHSYGYGAFEIRPVYADRYCEYTTDGKEYAKTRMLKYLIHIFIPITCWNGKYLGQFHLFCVSFLNVTTRKFQIPQVVHITVLLDSTNPEATSLGPMGGNQVGRQPFWESTHALQIYPCAWQGCLKIWAGSKYEEGWPWKIKPWSTLQSSQQ